MLAVIDTDDSTVVDVLTVSNVALQVDGEDLMAVETGDHTLDTALDVQEAVLVDVAQVTGMDPDLAVGMLAHDIVGFSGVIEVTLHHGRTGDTDFAIAVVAQLLAGLRIEDTHIDGQGGNANTALLVNIVDTEGCSCGQLGHAVTLCQREAHIVLLAEFVQTLLQALVHAVAAGCQSVQEGQVHILHFAAADEQFDEDRGADDMVGTVGLNQLADFCRNESGDGNQGHTHTQRHMHTTNQAVCCKDGDDTQEAVAIIVVNCRVDKVHANGVHGIVSHHNTLGNTGGTASIGDGHQCVANIGSVHCNSILASVDEFLPRNHLVRIRNVRLILQLQICLLDQRHGSAGSLDNDVVLIDLLLDCLNLGICQVQGNQNAGTGAGDHACNTFDVHTGVNAVCSRTQAVQSIDGCNGLRNGCGQERNDVTFLDTHSCERISGHVYPMNQIAERDILSIIMQSRCIQTILVALDHKVKSFAVGHSGVLRFLRIVFHPYFFFRNFQSIF